MICPKCQFEQPDNELECPRCGIIFAKYAKRREALREKDPARFKRDASSKEGVLKNILFYVPDDNNPIYLWGRALVLLFVFIWGWKFILSPIASDVTLNSFMHLVNLPFHEAGHLFFSPLGRVIHSLGGTLGQLLMPFVCLTVLLLKTRDPFGASIALWWLGQNYIDIAPYINDARSLTLPLLGGNTGYSSPYGFHDWEFILTELNLLRYDHFLANLSHKFGILVMVASYLWGAYVLKLQYRKLKSAK